MAAKRCFELASKFWEIWRGGTKVLTRQGKLGASGHTKVKDCGTAAAAKQLHDQLVEQKTREGYVEASATSARKSAAPAARFPFPTEVPALAAPAAKAPRAKQLAAFAQAVDIGPLDWTDKLAKGRSAADLAKGSALVNTRPLWDQIQARIQLVSELAKRLVAHANDRSVSDALTRVVREHPCDSIRHAVGTAIVDAGAPAKALAEIARWIEEPAEYGHWNWQTGARAVLLSQDMAFETLEPHLANARYADRVLGALQEHAGEIDGPHRRRVSVGRRTHAR